MATNTEKNTESYVGKLMPTDGNPESPRDGDVYLFLKVVVFRTRSSRLAMDWFSRMDDVTLSAIFEHFANPDVSIAMIGPCRRVFIHWMEKRRQLALDELRHLKSWLHQLDVTAVKSGNLHGGQVEVRAITFPLGEIQHLLK